MNNASKHPSGRKLLVAAIASTLVPASANAAVGRIDFAWGDVSGVDAQGRERRLTGGAPVNEGDTIVTRRGRAQIRFTDGARTSLLPESEFRVDRYRYEAQKEEESTGFFSLLKGGLRTITGAIGRTRRDGYRVTTPTATIGIRGTEYLAVLGNSLSVWVGDGEIEACNRGGCEVFEGGESGYVADEDTKPIHTDQKPDTSSGDIGNDPYSAPEDVTPDGTPDVLAGATGPLFADGQFYVIAVARGDGGEAFSSQVGTLSPDELVNATFVDDGLVAYTHSGLSGAIGTASLVDSGGDGIVGWGRWTGGSIDVDEGPADGPVGAVPLDDPSESHHFAIGLPTMDMPVSGTASYSLLGATRPTEADSGGLIGTLNSASLNVNFGTSKVQVDVNFNMGAANYDIDTLVDMGVGPNRFRFDKVGNFTTSGNCSAACFTRLEGFFAGAGASRAGLTYQVEPDFGSPITGAAAFKNEGTGSGTLLVGGGG